MENNYISIIIPNYNGMHHLECCLASLRNQSYRNFRIIIVDNNSTDNSLEFVKKKYNEVLFIELKMNEGFAKAVNIGIKKALQDKHTKYILLLNNDIECDEYFVEELINGFNYENVGSVSPKMMNFFKRDIIDGAGDEVYRKKLPYPRGIGQKDTGQYSKIEYIFGACAGAAMYKKEVFKEIGFFDEDFFAYFEDVDYSFRLQYRGYKCIYFPAAICYHKRGGSFSTFQSFQTFLVERNIFSLRIKVYPLSVLLKYFIYYNLHSYYRIIKYFIIYTPNVSYAVLKGYIFGLFTIPGAIKKRINIQKNKKVNNKYIIGLMK